jgi:hypothetical protein
MKMGILSENFEKLIREEGLEDIGCLLIRREWDEVPLVSRVHRIAFLSDFDVMMASCLLVANAVVHLDRILAYARESGREDVVVMVSVLDWDDLVSDEAGPVTPNFWICTNVERDMATFRLKAAESEEARTVVRWLRQADLLSSHEAFDFAETWVDPELRRVYVAQRGSASIERFVRR